VAFHITLDALAERFVGEQRGRHRRRESRGSSSGCARCAPERASFVPVRKPGRFPRATDRVSYSLEYGKGELEMHVNGSFRRARHRRDDLLATGGTAGAAGRARGASGREASSPTPSSSSFSPGRRASALAPVPVVSLIHYA